MSLDDAASSVEGQVKAAIAAWRDDHEEQLIKNRRFSKKSFQSLEDMVPKLVSFIMKAKNESRFRVTNQSVRKIVFSLLSKKFSSTAPVLSESVYEENEMIAYRMNKLAGLVNE